MNFGTPPIPSSQRVRSSWLSPARRLRLLVSLLSTFLLTLNTAHFAAAQNSDPLRAIMPDSTGPDAARLIDQQRYGEASTIVEKLIARKEFDSAKLLLDRLMAADQFAIVAALVKKVVDAENFDLAVDFTRKLSKANQLSVIPALESYSIGRLKDYISANSADQAAYQTLAVVYECQKLFEPAVNVLSNAIASVPKGNAHRYLLYLQRAGDFCKLGRTDEAVRDYSVVLSVDDVSTRNDALLGLAKCLENAHRDDEALRYYCTLATEALFTGDAGYYHDTEARKGIKRLGSKPPLCCRGNHVLCLPQPDGVQAAKLMQYLKSITRNQSSDALFKATRRTCDWRLLKWVSHGSVQRVSETPTARETDGYGVKRYVVGEKRASWVSSGTLSIATNGKEYGLEVYVDTKKVCVTPRLIAKEMQVKVSKLVADPIIEYKWGAVTFVNYETGHRCLRQFLISFR